MNPSVTGPISTSIINSKYPSNLSEEACDQSKKEVCDPWKNRSGNMKCTTCMWYVAKSTSIGRCRRHSPTLSGYPVVYWNDWCGDHKLNEK